MPSKCRALQSRSGNRTLGRADGEGKSQLGLRSDRRCVGKSRASSIRSDGGQCPPSPRHLSSAEAKAIGLMEELSPLTPERFGGNGLLHDGSPNTQRVDDLLCAVLHIVRAHNSNPVALSPRMPAYASSSNGLLRPT